jgi:S-DNA-T family DNA segregation ATPase FtsK/SpoIIIE
LGIGYGRAARLIDFMAEDGIVGEYNGSQAREVSITIEQWEVMRADADAEPASKGRGKKIRRDEGWSEAPKPKVSKKKKAAPREEVAVSDFEEQEPVWEDDE